MRLLAHPERLMSGPDPALGHFLATTTSFNVLATWRSSSKATLGGSDLNDGTNSVDIAW